MMKYFLTGILILTCFCKLYPAEQIITPSGGDDASLIQTTLNALNPGDTLLLNGDFLIAGTVYLPSDFIWILNGTLTLAGDADLDQAGYVSPTIDATRRTGITEKAGGATNIDMSGGTYYGNSSQYTQSMRFINFGSVTNSKFHDMLITEVTDDNFTLGPGCNNNECRNLIGSYSRSGNAMTDKGDHNTWIDCVAEYCLGEHGDGWTPKCRYSTFIRCIAANNGGPGFGMYAREEGHADNKDVGAHIIGNKFIDCVSYGSGNSSGFSFNISSNCPGAIIRDNYIQALCYDNHSSGVFFRNKDDAEAGIITNNVVDIVCYGNKGLNKSGNPSSWAGGLGMENDNSSSHNIIENITGSVVCYDNSIDVNTRGGHHCNIAVYHPEGENTPTFDDNSSGNNTVAVMEYACSDSLDAWCQYKYCGAPTPPKPNAPTGLFADVVSSSQIDLTWTDTTGSEDGFVIERRIAEHYYIIGRVGANVTSYSDTGLSALTACSYRVQAFNISGFSAYSGEISATSMGFSITIEPTGSDDDTDMIQSTLDGLQKGDSIYLKGDFVIVGTIYLPSDITWILDGSLTVSENIDLDRVGFVGPGVDARRPTAITEKPGGATDIEMSGGTYYGYDIHNGSSSIRFLNFVSVSNSYFHDFTVNEGSDDGFTLGPECRYNECRNLTGTGAHGNALTDKGEYNKWYDCIAEDCDSDGWTPKCRYSEFYRCIGRRNAGPGFGMFARLDGSGNPVDLGEIIVGNKFYDCESYDNIRGGFSFNIAGTSGHGSIIRDNYIQAVCYNNGIQGVTFRNKQDDGIIENNMVDIIAYGNKGLNSSGGISSFAGGLGVEGTMSGISGSVIAYDNAGYDVNIKSASNCTIKSYHPDNQNQPVLNLGSNGNTIEVIGFSCSDQLEAWCQYKYCGAPTASRPNAPAGLSADVVSSSQIKLTWSDNTSSEDGFVIERRVAEHYYIIGKVGANVTSYSDTELSALTAYTYRVQAFNVSGFSDYTNEISATTDDITSTSSHLSVSDRDLEIKSFPNPFHSSTQFEYTIPVSCMVSLKVYDLSGRVLKTLVHEKMPEGTHISLFDGSFMSGGTYIFILHAGDRVESGRFILL